MNLRLQLAKQALKSALMRKLVGPHVRAMIVDAGDMRFAIDPEDFGVGRELRRRGRYGEDEIARISQHLRPQDRLLVVGSHVGTLALPLARRCREVVAIEANPHTYDLLATNVALNGLGNVRTYQLAASDAPGQIDFLLNRANSGGSKRMPLVDSALYTYDKPQRVQVRAVRLDDHLSGQDFDVVVMDIEGSEVFALRGMPRMLEHCRTLFVEFVPHHLRNVAGVDGAAFAALLEPHFSCMSVPSLDLRVGCDRFVEVLGGMFVREAEDPALVFSKDA